MKKFIITIILFCFASLLSCCCGEKVETTAEQGGEVPSCGADRDINGCIGTAGYVWSYLLEECVRPWEIGTKVAVPKKKGETYEKHYNIVFSQDSTRAELIGIDTLHLVAKGEWITSSGNLRVVIIGDEFVIME